MSYRPSTGMTLALVFVITAVLSQWVSYRVAAELLKVAVHEREIDRIKAVSRVVQGMITQQANRVSEITRVLATQGDLGDALQLTDPKRTLAVADRLDRDLGSSNLDILEVTDQRETIIYRAHDPQRKGDHATTWGIAEALAGTGMTVSSTGSKGVEIRAVEPLRANGKVVGTLSAGMWINDKSIGALSTELGADLALLSRDGATIALTPSLHSNVDARAVTEAFLQKIPIYREDAVARRTSVYLPILIVDEAFVILAQIDSTAAYQLLDKSARKSMAYTALIVAASIVLLLLTLRYVLGPLRRLRERAEKTAIELTGHPIQADKQDEVTSVVQVLETLTQRLVNRNRELAEAKAEADTANEAKSQFLSSMSHEIRTPLNGVLGMAELLEDTPLNSEQSRYVRSIAAAGRTLHDLLSDILDLAKIEAGRIQIENLAFEPAHLIADIADAYRELASDRGNIFVADFDPAVSGLLMGDPTRVRQVLSNLLGNAVKFTERGTVTLSTEKLDAPAGDDRFWMRITVRDTGIGIAAAELGNLFKPFTQADASTNRRFGGSGLGLVICKHLVELMGGPFTSRAARAMAAASGSIFPSACRIRQCLRFAARRVLRLASQAACS